MLRRIIMEMKKVRMKIDSKYDKKKNNKQKNIMFTKN